MGEKRRAAHIRQLINNCGFEYEEGRVSALTLLATLCRLLPPPVLNDYSKVVFFPMASQIGGEEEKCFASTYYF